MNAAVWFWLGLAVLFCVMEGATAALVSVWFAAGSLAAVLAAALGAPLWLQVLVFLIGSGVLLALLMPLAKKYINPKITPTNKDSVIGTVGLVTAEIDNLHEQGQVKLGGMYWTARSSAGDGIPKDTPVRVDRIAGVKVFVTPVGRSAGQASIAGKGEKVC